MRSHRAKGKLRPCFARCYALAPESEELQELQPYDPERARIAAQQRRPLAN